MADYRSLRPAQHDVIGPHLGVIAVDAANLSDPLPVILPDFDADITWGPCRWQSRDAATLPNKGDTCLVIFDNRREPWIVAWWPF